MALTWVFYQISMYYVDHYVGSHFTHIATTSGIWEWVKHHFFLIIRWIFIVFSNIIAFYLAFLISYCLTTPGYAFLSSQAENIYFGKRATEEGSLSIHGLVIDLVEGCKIGLFGIAVTIFALFINFIPGIGQLLVFLLYCFYSCLMFIDYPSSERRWSLGKKLQWLKRYPVISIRLGILPALISLLPVINVFVMSLLFPILTVQATLNFASIENHT